MKFGAKSTVMNHPGNRSDRTQRASSVAIQSNAGLSENQNQSVCIINRISEISRGRIFAPAKFRGLSTKVCGCSCKISLRNFGKVSREQLKDEIRRTSISLLLHNTERTASKFTCRKRKENFSFVFTYSINSAGEIRHFHVTLCRCSALTAEKCTMKRRDTLAKLLFC